MKLTSEKAKFNRQSPGKTFVIPEPKVGKGLNQGILIAEIFDAANAAIDKVARMYDYRNITESSKQVLFFGNVTAGDTIVLTTNIVRRIKDIKVTVALKKIKIGNDEVVATGKFLYVAE
ncbi:hypothetical protein [Taibaiella soli]|uniref:Thioesterase domain-containing protein n=1 Tax=Taibaiella soli TaxID=1649169 RepID=A0A2W2BDJ1_9BACT|nr:hypothetical protein [Taibaiella soli]PZF71666.1 hypothetical protein DN068_16490 [Taibaiella soli]